jgi:hypothetical protein
MPDVVEEVVAEPEQSVEAEEVVEESVDIVAMISDTEEEVKPVLDKKDKAIIKFKQRDKQSKRENEELRKRLEELERREAERTLAKPNREEYEDEDKYAEDLESFITRKASASVEDTVKQKLEEKQAELEREAFIERNESVIRSRQPKANELIAAHLENKPEVAAIIQSEQFMNNLAQLPLQVTKQIVSSDDVAYIFEYYAKHPQRFANLAANDSEELLNLGATMGQIKALRGKSSKPNVIKPLQGGDNTAKRDPIKDYDKYKLPDGTHDTDAWRRDMFGNK